MAYGQIVTLRLANGQTVEFADWSDKPLYSKAQLLHGTQTQEMIFFQYTQGDAVPAYVPVGVTATPRTANELDTNMALPASLSAEEEFLVFAIRPEVFLEHVTDPQAPDFQMPAAVCNSSAPNNVLPSPGVLGILGMRTIMYLEISEKRFPQAGFNYFNTGFGVSITDGGTAKAATNGLPSQEAVRTLVIPSHIGGTEKFKVALLNPDGVPLEIGYDFAGTGEDTCDETTFADIRIYLDGIYRRGTA